jgi:DNA topoisomerase-1
VETKLYSIEEGKFKWNDVVRDFYIPFDKLIHEVLENAEPLRPEEVVTEEKCEKCGHHMVIKWGRYGKFLACSGYPECKNTKPLEGDNNNNNSAAPQHSHEVIHEKCPKCGSDMLIKQGKFGKFFACSRYPECKTTKSPSTGIKCPECKKGDIVQKRTKRGNFFFGCNNYPDCKFASWSKPVDKACPECGAAFLVEKKTKEGEFLACTNKECKYQEEKEQEHVVDSEK